MAASNFDDVCLQLRTAGLLPRDGQFEVGKLRRCRVEGEREMRGWYHLHEISRTDGTLLIVGSFGIWRGNENNAQRVQIAKSELSTEQLDALRKRLAEDRRRADQARAAEADRAAQRAAQAWAKYEPTGHSDYLVKKGVGAHGVRFTSAGALVVPMCNVQGQIRGIQIIRSHAQASVQRKLQKEFWPRGHAMGGTFHTLGMITPGCVILIAEGYATGATLHEATGLPVVVAWSAGNLGKVADVLRRRYAGVRVLLCADDDDLATCPSTSCGAKFQLGLSRELCPSCGQPHKRKNAGVEACSAAAIACSGGWIAPAWPDPDARFQRFVDHDDKRTDFNDLELDPAGGRDLVSRQISAKLEELGWAAPPSAPPTTGNGGGDDDGLHPIDSLDELLQRFALVYGAGGTVFDAYEHCLLPLSDMRDACIRRELHRVWAEHPRRRIVRKDEVDFDPSESNPAVTCNLWSGWPTQPRAGRCEKLLDLLLHMCSNEGTEDDPARLALYKWILCWLAYPLQHPGAKMKTTVVMHGPQGTGKNLFFEAVMAIYGRYGDVVDQSAVEDKFNDWASRKLFLIADEVVARSDLYHVKNKLKAFITGGRIRINPKNIAAYTDANHVNLVFLSNEAMPVVLEEDDRRHAIIWTPGKLSKAFYDEVLAELRDGGAAALHEYLLNFDLSGFNEGTLPPDTEAKRRLIGISLDSTSRFYYDLMRGDIGEVKPGPALSEDVYSLYKAWCVASGHRSAPLPRLVNNLELKHKVRAGRKRYENGMGDVVGPHGVLYFTDAQAPPGARETAWLGVEIERFRTALNKFRGAAHG
jgi:putative DNA primase/helicase